MAGTMRSPNRYRSHTMSLHDAIETICAVSTCLLAGGVIALAFI